MLLGDREYKGILAFNLEYSLAQMAKLQNVLFGY